jgi:protease-4
VERLTAGVILLCCVITAIGSWAGPARERTESRGFSEGLGLNKGGLAEIEVVGGIVSRGTGTNSASSHRIVQAIRQAEKDNVKGLLVTVDSPGGSAAASQEVYSEILRFKNKAKIPVICSMGDIAASGGYYIAAAADEIVANRATLTGSIGVIMYLFNAQGLLNKVGIAPEVIKTGPFKDIASPYRPMTPPERQLLQDLIGNTYQQFLGDVAKGRKMTLDQVKSLAGGRIYTGEQAQKLKLVDSLGSRTDAIRILARKAGVTGEPKVKNYTKGSWTDWIDDIGFEGRSWMGPFKTAVPALQPFSWQAKVPLALYD